MSPKDEVLGIAGGAGLNLAGAAFSHGALLGVFVILSRALGTADVGLYAQAFAFLSLLSALSLSGVQAALTRFVAVHIAEGDHPALRGAVRAGLALTTASALVLGATLYLAAPWLAERAFHDPALLMPLRYAALTLPAATFMDAALAATRGFKTMKAHALIGLIAEPAIRLGLTLALVASGVGLAGAMIALLASHSAAAALAAAALRRMMGAPASPPAYLIPALLRFSGVSWVAGLATTGLVWVDTILIGILGSSADVGLYSVATRVVALATFVMLPINASFAPRIADLSQRGDTAALERSYGLATGWILRLSLPAFILLLVYPHDLLSLLGGSGFAVAAAVTAILAVGRLIEAGTGPCGLMLTMSGRPALVMIDNLVVLGLNIGLNIWLIPRYGILGSATAWAISLGLVNLARVTRVWLTMRMLPFNASIAKGAAAGVGALITALAVQRNLAGPASLPVAAAALALVYLSLLLTLGLPPEDRLILRTLASHAIPNRRRGLDPTRT
ncbi:MAG: flippase [Egibacteraceae bacterium]